MSVQEFEVRVESGERGRVFIPVPFAPDQVWGKPPRYFVWGTINEAPFQGSLGVAGGHYFMPLNRDLQQRAAAGPGTRAQVRMEPGEPVRPSVPPDLERALAGAPVAARFFATLTAFQQNTYVDWIIEARRPEVRAGRIGEIITLLAAGHKQR
jgi:hypothetical protein